MERSDWSVSRLAVVLVVASNYGDWSGDKTAVSHMFSFHLPFPNFVAT